MYNYCKLKHLERLTKLIQQAYADSKYSAEELAEYLINNGVTDRKERLRLERVTARTIFKTDNR